MLRCRSASRTQLAEMAKMSQATVGRIVDDLISQSVLSEIDNPVAPANGNNGTPQLGRPSRPLELDRKCRRFLLVQLGVRQTRLAAVPVAIPSEEEWPVQFATPDSSNEWRDALRDGCRELPLGDIEAVILSSPGVVDEPANKVLLSPNLRWEERTDFPEVIRSVINAPLIIIQEIRALALGQLAAEPELEDFLLVDFGDGVGAASMVMAKLQLGHIPLSGELGHTPVLNNDRRCGCGATGCVETLVSRPGMIRSSTEHGGPTTWEGLVAEVHEKGLPDWMKLALDATAMTVAAALNVEGIASVLFTGSISELPSSVTDYLFAQVQRGAMWGRLGTVNCKTAPRRRMAGMICSGIDRVLFVSES
jgi:predicted NBD/HSP70 family sugar kinase